MRELLTDNFIDIKNIKDIRPEFKAEVLNRTTADLIKSAMFSDDALQSVVDSAGDCDLLRVRVTIEPMTSTAYNKQFGKKTPAVRAWPILNLRHFTNAMLNGSREVRRRALKIAKTKGMLREFKTPSTYEDHEGQS